MRMSISTTSGARLSALAIASRPSPASPDDLDVRLGLEDHAEARPDQALVVGEQHADHRVDPSGSRARSA